jgi:hypothetical protein
MKGQEQFLPLENYKSEWNKPKQLEIFPEEARAQIVDVFNAKPEDIRSEVKELEPLDANVL